MTYWTDLYLMRDADDTAIAIAVAVALGVSPLSVAVASYGTPEATLAASRAGVTVIVQRQDLRQFDEGGAWPIELSIGLVGSPPGDDLAALKRIARKLAIPFIVNIAGDPQDMFRIVFPEGDAPLRLLDNHDEPVLTDDDRRRLARYRRPSAIAS